MFGMILAGIAFSLIIAGIVGLLVSLVMCAGSALSKRNDVAISRAQLRMLRDDALRWANELDATPIERERAAYTAQILSEELGECCEYYEGRWVTYKNVEN